MAARLRRTLLTLSPLAARCDLVVTLTAPESTRPQEED